MADRTEPPHMPQPREHRTIHSGGEWLEAVSGATREIIDPADGRPFAVVAEGDEKDTDLAVAAARAAFDEARWRAFNLLRTVLMLVSFALTVGRSGNGDGRPGEGARVVRGGSWSTPRHWRARRLVSRCDPERRVIPSSTSVTPVSQTFQSHCGLR